MQRQTDKERIDLFLEKIFRISKSYNTQRSYKVALNKFQKFVSIQYNLDINHTLRQIETKKLDALGILDEFYTYQSKCNLSDGTIRGYTVVAKEFLNAQGLHIYHEDLKQRFRLPKKRPVFEEGLTKEILVRLLHNSQPKLQTAILVCASSGMRIGELVQLKISDIDFGTNPTTIRLRKETTKTKETRFTCITSEATKSLKDYLRRAFDWSEESKEDRHIFLLNHDLSDSKRYHDAVQSAKCTLMNMILAVVKTIPELSMKNENGRNNIHFHALRAWFKTQVTDAHQSDFAEALMGHTSMKLGYYRQNNEARLKTYLEIEPHLIISDFTKVEKNMQEISEKYTDLEIKFNGLLQGLKNNNIPVPEYLLQKLEISSHESGKQFRQ